VVASAIIRCDVARFRNRSFATMPVGIGFRYVASVSRIEERVIL
jgi:hypothetical protein